MERGQRVIRGIVPFLLIQHLLMVAWAGWVKSPVFDEFPHLAAGLSHLKYGEFSLYRVNPPLVRAIAAIPVALVEHETDWAEGWPRDPKSRPEFMLGQRFARANRERSFWLFTLARWACLPFMLLGGWVCFAWGKELYGTASGVTALVLWCFCPNLIGWGATICPDAPAAATGLLAAYLYHRWLRDPSLSRAALAGLALGFALLTKTTWIILPPLWLLLYPYLRPGNVSRRRSLGQLALLLGLSWYTLCAGYGFQGAFRSLHAYTFVSTSLNGGAAPGEFGNRFRGTFLGELPVPLPEDYVMGIDIQRSEFEKGKWSYLRGEQRFGGWWYWYLYALGVKTPVGSLALLILAIGTWWWLPTRWNRWRDELPVLVPAIALLLLVSSQTGFNRYLRYALPAVPFLYVFASRFAQIIARDGIVILGLKVLSARWGGSY